MEKRFLTVKECAEYLNISVHYLYRKVELKQIPHVRLGRAIRFDVKKLEKLIEENSIESIDSWRDKLNL